jgi:putative aldouronate transport system permease protein
MKEKNQKLLPWYKEVGKTSPGTGKFLRAFRGRKFRTNLVLLLMALPALLQLIIFKYFPLSFLTIAFENYKPKAGIFGSAWVGLENFKFIFGVAGKGWQVTRNTIAYNTVFIIIGTVIAVMLAILLSEVFQSIWSKFYQTAFFLPNFLSWVVVGYAGYALFSSRSGLLNGLLVEYGHNPIEWYKNASLWPFILLIANTWKNTGIASIVYLSAIVGINPEYYEVAQLDGANKWHQIRYLTIPLIMPIIIVMVLLSVGRVMYADFGLFYEMPRIYLNPQLIGITDVYDTFVYRSLLNISQLGMVAAASLFQSVAGFVIIVLANWVVRHIDPERALF